MMTRKNVFVLTFFIGLVLFGCSFVKPQQIPVDKETAKPGGVVVRGETKVKLLGKPISIGNVLPSVKLVDAMTMEEVDLSKERGSVLFLSIVPSIDTKVCEAQSHYLGEKGNGMPPEIQRITVSRDTPFAQKRFAQGAKLTQIQFLSDYKQGNFGRSVGLLMEGSMLLSRSVILVDKKGFVKYIQVVPDITHLPDMEAAFQKAIELSKEGT
jgi:thioredoxin-dependent peroxiredoxin